jgi:hypothetical protein
MGHFYHPTTGELIDGNLRDARRVNGLPSPTTVLGILSSPGLRYYFRKQMFEATATTPRLHGQSDDDYFEKCCIAADEHGQAARDKGGDFHSLVQRFHMKPFAQPMRASMMSQDDPLLPQFTAYTDWYFANVKRSIMVEQAVIGQGYAGRVDHVAEMMDGRLAVCDVKTQDTTKKKGKFTYYSNWGVQLGAYSGAIVASILPRPDVLISIAVSSNLPAVVEAYEWPKPPAYYHRIFLGLLEYWYEDNNYWPANKTISPDVTQTDPKPM